jgi:UDP-N-acetylmuramoyl-L-alanyl-D-glutamate--2,6-diaminopimelate ligase
MTHGLQIIPPSQVIPDREAAINYAVSRAQEGDLVVVLGKGHELGQEINGDIFPFDDRAKLREAIVARR